MTTFRTTARISLAALALVFGANFATANDKTPAKPPVAYQSGGHGGSNVQGHKLDDAKKPSNILLTNATVCDVRTLRPAKLHDMRSGK